jgi:hypothetical protein
VTGRVDWGDVLNGRGFVPQSLPGRTEDEQRRLRAQYELQMDQADDGMRAGGVPVTPWRMRQAEALRVAAEVAQRGTWAGSGQKDCLQCKLEKDTGVVVGKVRHEHWQEDRELEERLQDVARLQRAERDGSIRVGGLPPGWRG